MVEKKNHIQTSVITLKHKGTKYSNPKTRTVSDWINEQNLALSSLGMIYLKT